MKKMNYEAPKAEMFEMQMPVVLAETTYVPGNTGGGGTGGLTPGSGPGLGS